MVLGGPPSSPRHALKSIFQSTDQQQSSQDWEHTYLNRRRFPKMLLEEEATVETDGIHVDDTSGDSSVPSKTSPAIQTGLNANSDVVPLLPAPHASVFEGISNIPLGRYSILLLPCAESTMPFSQFETILARTSRTMFYTVADCNHNGTITPTSNFEMVVPLANVPKPHVREEAASLPLQLSLSPTGTQPNAVTPSLDSISQVGGLRPSIPFESTGSRARSLPPTFFPSPLSTPSPSRRTRFATPTSAPAGGGGTALDPLEERKSFRSSSGGNDEGGFTVWYHTEAPYALTSPRPLSKSPSAGTIYVHTNISNSARQVWVWLQDGTWCLVEAGDTIVHPVYNNRYLWVHSNGVPSWIVKGTLKSYSKQQLST